jgi:hypothetical protein
MNESHNKQSIRDGVIYNHPHEPNNQKRMVDAVGNGSLLGISVLEIEVMQKRQH